MTTTLTQQPAPDYGEPWQLTNDFAFDITIRGELAASFDKIEHANRAVSCVNACAGMADPAAEIQAMRIAAQDLVEAIQNHDYFKDRHNYVGGDLYINKALANLKPFLKP